MKYNSLAVMLLVQSASLVTAKHHLKQHSISKQNEHSPKTFMDIQSDADHLDDDEEVNERLLNKRN